MPRACREMCSVVPVWLCCFALSACSGPDVREARLQAALQEGAFVHAATGTVFLSEVLDFARIDVRQYDSQGLDASATYMNESEVLVTIYVYPIRSGVNCPERALAEEFQAAREAVSMRCRAQAEGSVDEALTAPFPGGTGLGYYTTCDRHEPERRWLVNTALFLYERGGWFIKIRATFPLVYERGFEDVDALLRSIHWSDFDVRWDWERMQSA